MSLPFLFCLQIFIWNSCHLLHEHQEWYYQNNLHVNFAVCSSSGGYTMMLSANSAECLTDIIKDTGKNKQINPVEKSIFIDNVTIVATWP